MGEQILGELLGAHFASSKTRAKRYTLGFGQYLKTDKSYNYLKQE